MVEGASEKGTTRSFIVHSLLEQFKMSEFAFNSAGVDSRQASEMHMREWNYKMIQSLSLPLLSSSPIFLCMGYFTPSFQTVYEYARWRELC